MTEGFSIKVDDSGVRDLVRRLRAVGENPEPVHRKAAVWLTSQIKGAHFERQEDESGKPWPPMAPLTRLLRRIGKKAGKGSLFSSTAKLLRDTGRLRNSIAYDVIPQGFEVGTNLKYAALQQFGSDGPITPKKGKFLFIPIIGTKKRQKAVVRITGKRFGVSGFEGTETYRKKSGKKKGQTATRKRHYLRLRSVTVPPRPFVFASDEEIDTITQFYLERLDRAIGRGN